MSDTKEKVRGFEVAIRERKFDDKGQPIVVYWEDATLPIRKTARSAGHDFSVAEEVVIPSFWKALFAAPFRMIIEDSAGNSCKERLKEVFKPTLVHTGIKAYMQDDEVLTLAVRSSVPATFGLILSNAIGIIDADYYGCKGNDGEIMFGFYNIMPWSVKLEVGTRIGQGVFSKFLKADNDKASGEREGGHGSTGH